VERGIRAIQSNGLPVWLVIFPEGTRYNSIENVDTIHRSRSFAKKKGSSPFEHVLYPRSGATVAAIHALKDSLNAIYDVTVMYCQTYDEERELRLAAPTLTGRSSSFVLLIFVCLLGYLQGQCEEVHIDVRRIDISEVRQANNEEIADWLYRRFDLKDK
jgi:1-acyl-sn-glycerol-3-phosphate acyltransferase